METTTKRDLILDAFRDLLVDDDIQHISVSKIAKQAGIGKGSIYYYFSSKDEILDALIKRTYDNALKKYTPWTARWYQAEMLRDKSRKKVYRCGRRTGKR